MEEGKAVSTMMRFGRDPHRAEDVGLGHDSLHRTGVVNYQQHLRAALPPEPTVVTAASSFHQNGPTSMSP